MPRGGGGGGPGWAVAAGAGAPAADGVLCYRFGRDGVPHHPAAAQLGPGRPADGRRGQRHHG